MPRNSLIAIILLVVLRLAIGWQLLYEGLWKLDTQDSARPWTSSGYLKNSVGPMRDTFRSMAGDPDEVDWLNYDVVAARWDDWAARFTSHYGLSDSQKKALNRLLNGSAGKVGEQLVYGSDELAALPEGIDNVNEASRVSEKIVWYDAEQKKLYVNAQRHLLPAERSKLMKLVQLNDDGQPVDESHAALKKAIETVDARQKRIGYKEKLAGAVKGNPDLLGNDKWQRVGQKTQYQAQLARYEDLRANAETDFMWDHLNSDWRKIQSLRGEITTPVKALEDELQEKASKLLTLNQIGKGPAGTPWTTLKFVDMSTIAGLVILGALLIFGFFTRFAAVMAAFMLFNFYMAMPPFPGVPELPGPEHSFIINKNLIEVIALLAIASLPTGRWFGVDAWLANRRDRKAVAAG